MQIPATLSYTLRRLALFGATLLLCAAVLRGVNGLVVVAVAAVVSGVLSYFLLSGPREQMARSMQDRVSRLNERMDAGAAREDAAIDAADAVRRDTNSE